MGVVVTNNLTFIYNFPESLPDWIYDLKLDDEATNNQISISFIRSGISIKHEIFGQFSAVVPNQKITEFLSNNKNSGMSQYTSYRSGLIDEQRKFSDSQTPVSLLFSDRTSETNGVMFGGDDVFYGSLNESDYVSGYAGDDRMSGFGMTPTGLDIFFGGDGVDTAVFAGPRSLYTVEKSTAIWDPVRNVGDLSGYIVKDKTKTAHNSGHLYQVERLEFSDVTLSVDTTGITGSAYRIYKAAFDRIPDATGLGYWIAQMDSGMDVVEVAARFIDSPEFRQLYGANVSNAAFITNVYKNVLDRSPDDTGLAWWVSEMQTNPSKTWQKVLADFSESAENKANVATLIANGITYETWE
jgi:hypothetical protein